jgi:hypothetical protein
MKRCSWKAGLILGLWGALSGCSAEQLVQVSAPSESPEAQQMARSLTPPSAMDSQGRDFWLAFPGNAAFAGRTLTLLLTGQTSTTGQVTIPGMGFTAGFAINPGQVTSVPLPSSAELTALDGVESKGVHITAGADVSVHGLSHSAASSGVYLGLPTDILGTNYLALGYKNTDVVNGSQFVLVAPQDDTTVTIVPRSRAGARLPGVAYTVTLQQGQTYQLRSTESMPADLSGSTITSNRPIAVFGGHACANIPSQTTTFCDYIVEQLPPATTWGKQFMTVPMASRSGGDTFRFLASRNGTQVNVNGSLVATLNRGDLHQMSLSTMAHVTSNEPILVAQYANGTSHDRAAGDPSMMLIPPYEQFLASYTVTTPSLDFPVNYINLVAPNAAVGQITLDGNTVPASAFVAIGSSGFSGASLTMTLGAHRLASPLPFGTFVYGFGTSNGYSYLGGMSLAPISTVASVAVAPKAASGQANTEHCVIATVRDQNQQPVSGVRVDWKVSGANSKAGLSTTASSGQAPFCYQGTQDGSDTIVASVGTIADSATMQWTANQAPVARCQNVTVGATCGGANVSVDDGSYDPDAGDSFACTQTPGGPYKPGTHHVTLTCTDSAGASSSCHATVTVSLEGSGTSQTALVLNGNTSMQLQCGVDTWVDPGAAATDMCGSPLAVRKFNSGDDDGDGIPGEQDPDDYGPGPDAALEGTYSVQYMAIDATGYTVSAIRSVDVDDTLPPRIVLNGGAQVTHTCGSQWEEPGVLAMDACYGDVSLMVQVTGFVNGWVEGTYTLRYDVTDSSGNSALPVTRTVTVVGCPW